MKKITHFNWVKLHCKKWLEGTTRFELDLSERAVFVDLLALSGDSQFPGVIASGINEDDKTYIGYPLLYLASRIVCDKNYLKLVLDKLAKTGKIEYTEKDDNYVIIINKFYKYQSEYYRQKQYRKKSVTKVTDDSVTKVTAGSVTRSYSPSSSYSSSFKDLKKEEKKEIYKERNEEKSEELARVEEQEQKQEEEKARRKEQCSEVVSYLNQKASTAYRDKGKATTQFISARLNEGFSVEQLKLVIDKKVLQWKDDEKMKKYLRPATLFNSEKFEAYLNEPAEKAVSSWKE